MQKTFLLKPQLFIVLGGCLLLASEAALLNFFTNAYVLVLNEVGGWREWFGHLSGIARWCLVFLIAFGVLTFQTLPSELHKLTERLNLRRVLSAGLVNGLAFGGLFYVSLQLYAPEQTAPLAAYWYLSWLILAITTIASWCLMWADVHQWSRAITRFKIALSISALVTTSIVIFAFWSQTLWGPMADLTFDLSEALLTLISNQEISNFKDERILGVGDFYVNIAPACSGYEGIGLIIAFISLFIYAQRKEIRFPNCFILYPIGIAFIWLLNILRISVLILIGANFSPEVAVKGFHSMGGWITFTTASLFVLVLASRSRWITHSSQAPRAQMTQATACLYPFIALLASTMITMALSAEFDFLYPLRVFVVALTLGFCWRALVLPKFSVTPLSVMAGIGVAIVWYFLVPQNPEYDANFSGYIQSMPTWAAASWVLLRFIGSVVTVPIAEELAFRGYLLCTFSKLPVTLTGKLPLHLFGLGISSVAFGALHGDYVAGIAAGLVYGWVRLQGRSIIDAIFAHALTNALLFLTAILTGRWILI